MNESWQKGYDILKKAALEAEKCNKEASALLKESPLSKENYNKAKELLEKEAQIRNLALEKVEKIHREQTKTLEDQWSSGESS